MIKLSRPRSNLFLIELTIAILSFALCAGICMRIFAKASIDLRESERLLSSMSNAENAAELYKHFSGDLEAVASALGGTAAGNALKIHYDKDWNVCPPALCEYTLTLAKIEYSQTGKADITVSGRDGKTIVSFSVTVYGGDAG